jgi:phosphotransferase system enzyme I (PtsI)
MISSAREVRQVTEMLESAKETLRSERRRFSAEVEVGAMIEIPAAALAAGQIAREVDFVSIGTNDLIQYALAIDRSDHAVNHLYDPIHPAVLRLISLTLQAGKRTGTPVAMCGEMAGDPRYTRLLLGLGLRDLSMHPANLLAVKDIVLAADTRKLRGAVQRLLRSDDPDRSIEILERLNRET